MKILTKVPFEFIPENIGINPNANQIFTSENYANLISFVDFDSKTKSKILEIEKPREIIFSPEKNRLYSIYGKTGFFMRNTGKKLGVIDLNSNQIIKTIGENEGFGGISRNVDTGKIFVTQPNKKKVWIIDENSLEVEYKIDVKGKYRKIVVAENKNEIILGNLAFARGLKIISLNLKTNQIRKIFSKSSDSIEDFEMKYYPEIHKIYVHRSEVTDDMGNSRGSVVIIDLDNSESKYSLTSANIFPYFDLSTANGITSYIQYSQISLKPWKESKYALVKRNLITKEKEIFDPDFTKGFDNMYLFGFEKFLIHPKTGNLIIFGHDSHFYLHEISLT
jgi:hypothetical protein